MYKYLFHEKPAQICTNLSLTASRHKCVQQNLSLSPRKLVQICSDLFPPVSWYKYVQHKSLSLCRPVQISTNPSLTGNQHQSVPFSSLPGSWYKYTQISIPREVGPSMHKSLSPTGTTLYLELYGQLYLKLYLELYLKPYLELYLELNLKLYIELNLELYLELNLAISSSLSPRPSLRLSLSMSSQPHSLYGHLSLSLSTSITASLSLRTSPPRSLYALSSPLSSRPSQPLSCPLSAQHLHKRA